MSSYIYFENDAVKYLESTRQEHVDLCLCFCGMEVCEPSYSFGPAIREQYIIHYILNGKGSYQVGDKIYSLEKNQGFLICPGDLTYYEADKDNPWTYIWVAFNGIKSEQYLKYANLNHENLIFECIHNKVLKNYVLDMLKINNIRNCDELKLQGLLYLFLSTISESNIDNNIETNDASYKLYIESLFKKNLNLSPQEFLLKFRMNKAYELLKNPELSIGDVSRSVGYIDPLTFSKTFKKYNGSSPKQYRENIYKK